MTNLFTVTFEKANHSQTECEFVFKHYEDAKRYLTEEKGFHESNRIFTREDNGFGQATKAYINPKKSYETEKRRKFKENLLKNLEETQLVLMMAKDIGIENFGLVLTQHDSKTKMFLKNNKIFTRIPTALGYNDTTEHDMNKVLDIILNEPVADYEVLRMGHPQYKERLLNVIKLSLNYAEKGILLNKTYIGQLEELYKRYSKVSSK